MNIELLFAILASLASIAFALYLAWKIVKQATGEGKMVEISQAIQEGAKAYLNRQYRTVGMVGSSNYFYCFIFRFRLTMAMRWIFSWRHCFCFGRLYRHECGGQG